MSVYEESDVGLATMFQAQWDSVVLTCPTCQSESTHIREVSTRLAHDEGQTAYPGTIAKGVTPHWKRAGLVITIDGECGHAFDLIIQQHKGQNFMLTRRVPIDSRLLDSMTSDEYKTRTGQL